MKIKTLVIFGILLCSRSTLGVAMNNNSSQRKDFSTYVLRRKKLVQYVREQYPELKNGVITFFADFEGHRHTFRQESSFYYLTGIEEPGVALTLDLKGNSTLYVPNCGGMRAQWVDSKVTLDQDHATEFGLHSVVSLGGQLKGYHIGQFCEPQEYGNVITQLHDIVKSGGTVFTLAPQTASEYVDQRLLLCRFEKLIPKLSDAIVDISPLIATMRRAKDLQEIEKLYKAVELTTIAHEAAAQAIAEGITEAEVQASLEYMFVGANARPSFPSIVASGKNATILHYTTNAGTLKNGELVVVDIGAEYEYYCADITRTYPVSGTFTKRQKELYNLVLDTQEYIASIARPGMWLSNKEFPEKSLNHLAKKYLEDRGYGKYFPHGIGHYLGVDVHDVGSYTEKSLQVGDVFTIEPGIYIKEEGIGIRIEDDYWMVEDGVVCLSEHLPKHPDDIEKMVQEQLEDDISVSFDDQECAES